MKQADVLFQEAFQIKENLVQSASVLYSSSLMHTSQNWILLMKNMDRAEETSDVITRLSELGISNLPESDSWIEEEEDF
jgi:hypothetical protein